MTQTEIFSLVSEDEYCTIDMAEPLDISYQKAKEFYELLTKNENMEGIVIKPDIIDLSLAPFIKVRNENYLSIVYGPDYKSDTKYESLLKQKSINKKIGTSIKEFQLGVKMLKVKHNDINMDNYQYIDTLMQFLTYEDKEKEIDPRL